MALETGIRDALLDPAANIEVFVDDKIRPLGVAADDARPYLTYSITGRETLPVLDGAPSDYRKAEFEIGIFADTYDQVSRLSDLVRDRLDQFGETVSSVEFAPIAFEGETDVEEATPEGQESPIYLRVQTFKCLYRLVD